MKLGEMDSQIIVRNAPHPFTGPVKANVDHISFAIENWDTDRVRDELEKRGLQPRHDTGPGHGYQSYHIKDPNRWDLQISNAGI